MASPAGVSTRVAATNIGVLRQKEIVRLLRSSALEFGALREYVEDLFHQQLLTQDVQLDVDELLLERRGVSLDSESLSSGTHCPTSASTSPGLPVASPLAKPSSRFEQDFEKVKLLGRGGFGEVWRVLNRVDQKEYAVKVVPFTFKAKQDPLSHPAVREAQNLARLQHQHIVRYHTAWVEVDGEDTKPTTGGLSQALAKSHTPPTYAPSADCKPCDESWGTSLEDYSMDQSDGGIVFESSVKASTDHTMPECQGDAAGVQADMPVPVPTRHARLFLQMEVIDHGSLREWIDRRNVSTADCADCTAEFHIFSQLVDAVAHIHAEGMVHRDIKPANILLATDDSVRLGDFGLLKATKWQGVMAPSSPKAASQALAVGTPSYASPEQLQGSGADVKADIYSLGVVLAELLCSVGTQMERAKLLEELQARQLPAAQDQAAASLALKMTSPNPAERPSISELQQCLREYFLEPIAQAECRAVGAGCGRQDPWFDPYHAERLGLILGY